MTTHAKQEQYEILPPHLAVKAMRDSGYRDTAHALAELVDNSVQAGQEIDSRTEVEVLCIDKVELVGERRRQRICEIGVYDNACGMDAETLRIALQFGNGKHLEPAEQKGIGKFGMGLPNASISQCRRVDVWSWQNGACVHTCIDVDEILSGKLRSVPEPKSSGIPKKWRGLFRADVEEHGTLVVWSKIDRVRWKTSTAFLRHAEFLLGRMYRYFLDHKRITIRLCSFEETGGDHSTRIDRDVLPNDPMYLMKGTSAPAPFDEEPAFDLFTEYPLAVAADGNEYEVRLRFSVTTKKARHCGGSAPIGKHAAKNLGVSLVRADRELEMNNTFDLRYDPRERWWGVEVLFGPELDAVFGVTNTKQAATAFRQCELDEDAAAEDLTPGEYEEQLRESNDPRLAVYKISHEITKNLGTIREQIQRMREGTRKPEDVAPPPGSAEDIATKATKRRREELGKEGKSDEDEGRPEDEREKELAGELIAEGVEEKEAKEIAVQYVRKQIKYLFQEAPIPGAAIFDIRAKAGTIIILINTRHPASEHLFALLKEDDDGSTPALEALKLLLTAWARLEDEAGEMRTQELEDIRSDWGRIARDFLQAAED
ncbi:MAG TPA: ATP-binding protein [Phycisphaerae bacterium]|nr:ATP-binding protein [Phycisphaerae bacterium]